MNAREGLAALHRQLDAGVPVSPDDLVVAEAAARIEERLQLAAERSAEAQQASDAADHWEELATRAKVEIPASLDRLDAVSSAAQKRHSDDRNAYGYLPARGVEFGLSDVRGAWNRFKVHLQSPTSATRYHALDVRSAIDNLLTESGAWLRAGLILAEDIDHDLGAIAGLIREITDVTASAT